jgi:hypothetical protein
MFQFRSMTLLVISDLSVHHPFCDDRPPGRSSGRTKSGPERDIFGLIGCGLRGPMMDAARRHLATGQDVISVAFGTVACPPVFYIP